MRAIGTIPRAGLLTATAAVATIGDAKTFKSGREFAASLGLVPRQVGSGGRTPLPGISKRRYPYLRTLLHVRLRCQKCRTFAECTLHQVPMNCGAYNRIGNLVIKISGPFVTHKGN